tara:strand:- start:1502 stop:1708 length:207 start_codon:yes stop_codon:yes gene_type:complete
MGWLNSILSILTSFFKVLDKKTLTYDEKVDKIERVKKEQVKGDWKETQNEIDSAFERAKSRNKLRDNQ